MTARPSHFVDIDLVPALNWHEFMASGTYVSHILKVRGLMR